MTSTVHEPPRPVRLASIALLTGAAVNAIGASVGGMALSYLLARRDDDTSVPIDRAGALVAELHDEQVAQLVIASVGAALWLVSGLAVRRPNPWLRRAAMAATTVVALAWIGSLLSDPQLVAPPSGLRWDEYADALKYLLPAWYPVALSFLVLAVVACAGVAAFMLLRTESGDFYRSRRQGPPGLWTYARRSNPA